MRDLGLGRRTALPFLTYGTRTRLSCGPGPRPHGSDGYGGQFGGSGGTAAPYASRGPPCATWPSSAARPRCVAWPPSRTGDCCAAPGASGNAGCSCWRWDRWSSHSQGLRARSALFAPGRGPWRGWATAPCALSCFSCAACPLPAFRPSRVARPPCRTGGVRATHSASGDAGHPW